MLTIKLQPYNSIWVSASSQKELGETFIRFQEYYESPNPEFHNKIFTLGSVKQWYSIQYGADLYSDMWVGFNFPSDVLIPFKQGLFDPLTTQEQNLLELLKYRNDKYYIIGAQDQATLKHELCHALYDHNVNYKTEIDSFIKKHAKKLTKATKYILKKGYHKNVINDELQAYIIDNDDNYIINNIDSTVINSILKIYNKYKNDNI